MKKSLKKLQLLVFSIAILLVAMFIQGCSNKNTVVIYSSNEDFRNDLIVELLEKELPEIKVSLQYYPTGTHAAKLKAEGSRTTADIFLDLEVGYAEDLKDLFAPLEGYDTSKYVDDILPSHNKYHIWGKEAGCTIINNKVLKEHNLAKPTSYEDLLKPEYKDLIIMPNPKSSSTGYYFYNSLVSTHGEEYALTYFDKLSKQVKQFSESGSGPVKAVDKGEIAIGLGMTFQAIKFVNNNPDLEIMYFEEGSPFALYGMGIIKGKEINPDVKKVYDLIYNEICMQDKINFNPETIYKNQAPTIIENYPQNISYSKMNGLFDPKYKENLLDKWKW